MNVIKNGKRFHVSDNKKQGAKSMLKKHKGKDFNTLSAKEKDELLKAALRLLGLLDENDVVR